MNLSETGEALALASEYDNRHFTAETSSAWWELLHPYTLDEAKHAIRKHYNESREWMMPADVLRIIKAERKARLSKLGPINPSRADMADAGVELTTSRELTAAIASGQLTPEQYGDYLRSDTPWAAYKRGILALRGAA